MTILQTLPATLPDTIPWWAYLLFTALVGVAGWFAAQVWPVWKEQQILAFKARLEEEKAEREAERAERTAELEIERAIRAEAARERLENERERVDAWKTVAQAMDQISRTLTVIQFEISDIRRHVGIPPRMSEDKKL